MTKEQELLIADVKQIQDEAVIEKIQIYIMGILTQKNIEKQSA